MSVLSLVHLRYYGSAIPSFWEDKVNNTTLLIIIIVIVLILGGGWYGRGRWF